jgi:hypothetical protein
MEFRWLGVVDKREISAFDCLGNGGHVNNLECGSKGRLGVSLQSIDKQTTNLIWLFDLQVI